ncbi:PREDICTED: uncharacterized protein LOC106816010 [Priapulus caudatus]|uniref:Uncharacterized protein LOC106816010 n=1 Tax=Priapulus caudatus TaxID=37621 RepID=A0ABM1EV08_PRICU|nr:PREDICTED: uncharacterized protein LOC106816010 [Priapulus caudatus]
MSMKILKTSLTKAKNNVTVKINDSEELLKTTTDGDVVSNSKLELQRDLLNTSLKHLEKAMEKLTIAIETDPDESQKCETTLDEATDLTFKTGDLICQLESEIKKGSAVPPAPPKPSADPEQPTPHKPKSAVSLPTYYLPHFDGNVMTWFSFWDSYEAAVHKREDLAPVEKFNYLRSVLKGDAYRAISGMELSNANYKNALRIPAPLGPSNVPEAVRIMPILIRSVRELLITTGISAAIINKVNRRLAWSRESGAL